MDHRHKCKNSKWTTHIYVRTKTKCKKAQVNLGVDNDFVVKTPKAQAPKEKNNKVMNFIKFKTFKGYHRRK